MSSDRRRIAVYALLAFAVGAAWVWAAGRIGGPAAAWRLATALGASTLGVGTLALLYVWRTQTGRQRAAVLAVVVICLAGTAGVVSAAHIANTTPTQGTVTIGTNDGLRVSVQGDNEMLLRDPQTLSGTANIVTEQGNATVFSAGSARLTFASAGDIEGTWTNATNIVADPNSVQIDPDDKAQVTVAQEITDIAFRGGMTADDGTVDFAYTAPAGQGEAIVSGLNANTQVFAIDASNGNILDDTTTSGSGAATFDALNDGTHDVLIQEDTNTGTPQLSQQSPTGDQSSEPQELSVRVEDAALQNGDVVTVTFTLDNSQIDQQTITSNQTVTASIPSSGLTGGQHSWSVSASDDYGNSASSSHTYSIPQNLTIRDEDTNQFIDDETVNLTVYSRTASPQVQNFSTDTGTVDMGTFPTGDPFTVVAEANNYTTRRIYVQNVYETQKLYLLNESVTTTDVIFRLEDYTGRFPPRNTTLQVERGIGGDWEVVLGDYFGATDQFESQLKYNTRHRLVLRNANTGDRRVLGSYTPLQSTEEIVSVSPEVGVTLPDQYPSVSITPSSQSLPSTSGVNVNVTVSDGSLDLSGWDVAMYHINGSQNTTLFTGSGSDAAGGVTRATLDLSGLEGEVKVVTEYTYGGVGATGTEVTTFNLIGETPRSMTLLDAVAQFVGLVPGDNQGSVTTLLAMFLTVFGTLAVGSVFRLSSEAMGVLVVLWTTAFSVLGWLPYRVLFVVLVAGAGLTFLRGRY